MMSGRQPWSLRSLLCNHHGYITCSSPSRCWQNNYSARICNTAGINGLLKLVKGELHLLLYKEKAKITRMAFPHTHTGKLLDTRYCFFFFPGGWGGVLPVAFRALHFKFRSLPWILCRYGARDSPYLAIAKQVRQTKDLRTAAWKLSDFYIHI